MGLDAGALTERIRLERRAPGTDDYGGEADSWALLAERWAQVGYPPVIKKAAEERVAAQQEAIAFGAFRIRQDRLTRSISPKDRLRFAPAETPTASAPLWNITHVAPEGRESMLISAILAADAVPA